MAKRGGSSNEEGPVISIVGMCATLLGADTTAISPDPNCISVHCSAPAAPPLRKRKPTRRPFQCRYRAPLEKLSKPVRDKDKIFVPLIVFDCRASDHAIEE